MELENWNRRKLLSALAIGGTASAVTTNTATASVGTLQAELPKEPLENRTEVSRYRTRGNPEVISEPGDSQLLNDSSPGNGGIYTSTWDHRAFASAGGGGSETEAVISWVDFEVSNVDDPNTQVDLGVRLDLDIEGKLDAKLNFWPFGMGGETTKSNDAGSSVEQVAASKVRPAQDIPGPIGYLDIIEFLGSSSGDAGYSVGAKVVKLTPNEFGDYDLDKTGVKNKDAFKGSINGDTIYDNEIDKDNVGIELNPSAYSDQIVRVVFGVRVEASSSGAGTSTSDFKSSGKGVAVEDMEVWVDDVSD